MLWIEKLLYELKIEVFDILIVYCDNMSADFLSKQLIYHAHTKHINIDFHFLIEKVLLSLLHIEYTLTQE